MKIEVFRDFFWRGRGNGGRCRRHAPTEAKKTADAEAPARHGRLGMSVFADGKKTERGGRREPKAQALSKPLACDRRGFFSVSLGETRRSGC